MSLQITWQQDLQFQATNEQGHSINIDADSQTAPCPTEMLLSALGSCSATDVIMGLQEAGAKISSFTNTLTYELTDDEPRLYKSVNLHFSVKGEDVTEESIETAADNAINKYCHVCLMLQPQIVLSYSYDVSV
jgi:putative redox protein